MTNKSSVQAVPVADCDAVDVKAPAKTDPTQLCMFMEPLTAAQTLERTVRYARDPQQYLREALGQSAFESKRAMLCLPEKVDMDGYGTGVQKQHFERHIARLLGKKEGLFFLTGVQVQLAALKIHCERAGRSRVAWHVSCHLESAERQAYSYLYGLDRVLLGNDAQALPTLAEIQSVLDAPEADRPAAILIEIPNRVLGCKTYTFAELQTISAACRAAGVALHCDGARLWEIEPYYAATASASFAEVGPLFDSVYLSFYKGLRGVTGAMLVHEDAAFIAEAKKWQRRAGGNAFTMAYETIDCERGFNEMIGTFPRKREKMIRIVDAILDATRNYKNDGGEQIIGFVPERANCSQILTRFRGYTVDELNSARDRVQEKTNVRVFERMRPKQSFDEKLSADESALASAAKNAEEKEAAKVETTDRVHFMEWMIMSVTEKIEDGVFVKGYVDLCEELLTGSRKD